MSQAPSQRRKSITESSWYWVYLFATGALIALVLMGWKFGERQAQIENKYLGHDAAARQAAGEAPTSRQLSSSDNTIISLTPLYFLAAAVFVVAWVGVWWQLFRRRSANRASPASNDAPPPSAGQVKT